MKKLFFSGAFFAFLIGCTVGPDYHQPIFFSDKQLEKALDLKPAVTHHLPFHPLDFHDETLTLLMKKAIKNAPTVRSAVLRVRQARQSVKTAAAALAAAGRKRTSAENAGAVGPGAGRLVRPEE